MSQKNTAIFNYLKWWTRIDWKQQFINECQKFSDNKDHFSLKINQAFLKVSTDKLGNRKLIYIFFLQFQYEKYI